MVFHQQEETTMKKLLLAIATVTAISSAPAMAAPATKYEVCDNISKIAGVAMIARQNDTSLAKLMSSIRGRNKVSKVIEDIVLHAYQRPVYNSEEYKLREIKRFANMYAAECYKKFK
jgi:hypothetical protein